MSKKDSKKGNDNLFSERENEVFDGEEYDEMELLERLETLREDMEDLGITTLAEVIQRVEEMHQKLDHRK